MMRPAFASVCGSVGSKVRLIHRLDWRVICPFPRRCKGRAQKYVGKINGLNLTSVDWLTLTSYSTQSTAPRCDAHCPTITGDVPGLGHTHYFTSTE
jgi:hypothetical protein